MSPRNRPAGRKWRAGLLFILPLLLPSLSSYSTLRNSYNLLKTDHQLVYKNDQSHRSLDFDAQLDKHDNSPNLDDFSQGNVPIRNQDHAQNKNRKIHRDFDEFEPQDTLVLSSLKSSEIQPGGLHQNFGDHQNTTETPKIKIANFPHSILSEQLDQKSDTLISLTRWQLENLFTNIDLCILTFAGLVCCFLGGALPKTSLHLLTFVASYYSIFLGLFFTNSYDCDNIHQQMGLFFGSLLMTFVISVCAFFFESIALIVFLLVLGLSSLLFCLQFIFTFDMVQGPFSLIAFSGGIVIGYVLLCVQESFTKFLIGLLSGTLLFIMNLSFLLELSIPFNEKIQRNSPIEPFRVNILSAFGLVLISSFFFQICFLKRTSCWVGLGGDLKKRKSGLKLEGPELIASDSIR